MIHYGTDLELRFFFRRFIVVVADSFVNFSVNEHFFSISSVFCFVLFLVFYLRSYSCSSAFSYLLLLDKPFSLFVIVVVCFVC